MWLTDDEAQPHRPLPSKRNIIAGKREASQEVVPRPLFCRVQSRLAPERPCPAGRSPGAPTVRMLPIPAGDWRADITAGRQYGHCPRVIEPMSLPRIRCTSNMHLKVAGLQPDGRRLPIARTGRLLVGSGKSTFPDDLSAGHCVFLLHRGQTPDAP